MSEIKFPVVLYHPASQDPVERQRFVEAMLKRLENKSLIAHTEQELNGLLKIGWKVRE